MYQLVNSLRPELKADTIKRLNDGAFIPMSNENTDYDNFKKDLADGAELQDAEGNVIDGIAYLATLESATNE
jgi:hypothetical protein